MFCTHNGKVVAYVGGNEVPTTPIQVGIKPAGTMPAKIASQRIPLTGKNRSHAKRR